jgi:hypothetical protein
MVKAVIDGGKGPVLLLVVSQAELDHLAGSHAVTIPLDGQRLSSIVVSLGTDQTADRLSEAGFVAEVVNGRR